MGLEHKYNGCKISHRELPKVLMEGAFTKHEALSDRSPAHQSYARL